MRSHSFLHAFFIDQFRVDFRGRVVTFGTVVGCSAAFLAASSALSFPWMFLCPGTHVIVISVFGNSIFRRSRLSIVESKIACPDCFPGFVVAIIAAWLSVYMVHCFVSSVQIALHMSVPILIAVTSATYTLASVLLPRYFCAGFSMSVEYAAAAIFPLNPVPSVYTTISF